MKKSVFTLSMLIIMLAGLAAPSINAGFFDSVSNWWTEKKAAAEQTAIQTPWYSLGQVAKIAVGSYFVPSTAITVFEAYDKTGITRYEEKYETSKKKYYNASSEYNQEREKLDVLKGFLDESVRTEHPVLNGKFKQEKQSVQLKKAIMLKEFSQMESTFEQLKRKKLERHLKASKSGYATVLAAAVAYDGFYKFTHFNPNTEQLKRIKQETKASIKESIKKEPK